MTSDKARLRRLVRKFAASLSDEYVALSDGGIFSNLISLPEYEDARSVLLFYSMGNEPDTHGLIRRCLFDGKTTALPVSYENGIMKARTIMPLFELGRDMWGIPAPTEDCPEIGKEDIDLIIVPGVTFARDGYRLGQGGGYYDRYLAGYEGFTVGLARSRMLTEHVPTDEHDMPVSCVVTENEILRF